jgi:peroxiredoxin Q/BCP
MKLILLLVAVLIAWAVWRAWNAGPLLGAGTPAPDFGLADQDGKLRHLSDHVGQWRVVYFYPRDDTPGCTKEACTFRDGLVRLQAAGAVVLGVSVDDVDSHRRFARKHGLNFPLLADVDGAVARRYGVLMDWTFLRMAKRVTFLVDPHGMIDQVYPKVDPERHAAEILARLEAGNHK